MGELTFYRVALRRPSSRAKLAAEVERLRVMEATVRAMVAELPTGDGDPGIYFFDSYRGEYCPCCAPDYDQEHRAYRHDPACPLGALVRLVAE